MKRIGRTKMDNKGGGTASDTLSYSVLFFMHLMNAKILKFLVDVL